MPALEKRFHWARNWESLSSDSIDTVTQLNSYTWTLSSISLFAYMIWNYSESVDYRHIASRYMTYDMIWHISQSLDIWKSMIHGCCLVGGVGVDDPHCIWGRITELRVGQPTHAVSVKCSPDLKTMMNQTWQWIDDGLIGMCAARHQIHRTCGMVRLSFSVPDDG